MHLEGRICVATDSSTVALRPGSIDQVIRYLEVWLGHGGHGIAWVEYEADAARDAAVARLESGSRLKVGSAVTRADWENLRSCLESEAGVVHVLFTRT